MIFSFFSKSNASYDKLIYDFSIKDINGNLINFVDYKNKAILIVNVASKCGFTKQYTGLQKIYELYEKKGLIVLGVPSNQFGGQEPGTSNEIKNFCETNFYFIFASDTAFPIWQAADCRIVVLRLKSSFC